MPTPAELQVHVSSSGSYFDAQYQSQNLWDDCRAKDERIAELEAAVKELQGLVTEMAQERNKALDARVAELEKQNEILRQELYDY